MDTDDPFGHSPIAHPAPHARARFGLAGAAVAAALTLSACGGISLPTGDGGQINVDLDGEGGSVSLTDSEGNEQNIDLETDDDSFTLTDGEGNDLMSGGSGTEVPEDFPPDIPLPDGELQFSSSVTVDSADSWTLGYVVPGDVASTTEDLRADLAGAGFEDVSTWETAEATATVLEGGGYTVSVMVTEDSSTGGTGVTYTVTQQN